MPRADGLVMPMSNAGPSCRTSPRPLDSCHAFTRLEFTRLAPIYRSNYGRV